MTAANNSAVNHPIHYNSHPSQIEAIDVIEYLTGNLFNAVKYVWRANHKGKPGEDTEKSLWYTNREKNRALTNLPEVPQFVYDMTDAFVTAEEDELRASIVHLLVYAHKSPEDHSRNVRAAIPLIQQMLDRDKALVTV